MKELSLRPILDKRDCQILLLLRADVSNQEELSKLIGLHQSNVSRHLRKMQNMGLVQRRQGQGYELKGEWPEIVVKLSKMIDELYVQLDESLVELDEMASRFGEESE